MMLFPEVQRKAQAEVDAVVGCDRLPRIADRDALPYVGAVLKEVLRWRPVVPLGTFYTLANRCSAHARSGSPTLCDAG